MGSYVLNYVRVQGESTIQKNGTIKNRYRGGSRKGSKIFTGEHLNCFFEFILFSDRNFATLLDLQ